VFFFNDQNGSVRDSGSVKGASKWGTGGTKNKNKKRSQETTFIDAEGEVGGGIVGGGVGDAETDIMQNPLYGQLSMMF